MNTKKKILMALALVGCAVLLVAGSIAGTLAYLTSTATVSNTFTVGNVTITMDEAPVDANGKATTGDRVTANTYKLFPGKEYDKDPTIHVDANSEDCWLFVKVVDGISAIQAETTVANQMTANGNWELIDATNNIYAYKEVANASDNVVVFKTFKIKGDVDNATLATYAGKTIVVTAYAIQADGFASAEAAWTAAKSAFGNN